MRRILYIHEKRFHPCHADYATSIGAEFMSIDAMFPYYYAKKHQRLKKYISWLLLLIHFPYKKYDVILTDEPKIIVALLKFFSFGRLKLLATQGGTTLHYYFENKISLLSKYIYKSCFNYYNLIICIGPIQLELSKRICKGNLSIKIIETFNGVDTDRYNLLSGVEYNPENHQIISLSNTTAIDFFEIKGMDIMLDYFANLYKKYSFLSYCHIGAFDPKRIEKLKKEKPNYPWHRIHFVGKQANLVEWFKDAVLMMHLSRKESFGLAVAEALSAGIPTFISENVGGKVMYNTLENGNRFIINIDDKTEINKVLNFLSLDTEEKTIISNKFRKIAKRYTSKEAIKNYKFIVEDYL